MKTIANMNTATNSRTHQPSRRTITTALRLAAANLVTCAKANPGKLNQGLD